MLIEYTPDESGYHDTVTVTTRKSYTYYGVPTKYVKHCLAMIRRGIPGAVFNTLRPYTISPPVKDKAITIADSFDRETLEEIKYNLSVYGEHKVAINGEVYIITTLEHLIGVVRD